MVWLFGIVEGPHLKDTLENQNTKELQNPCIRQNTIDEELFDIVSGFKSLLKDLE